MTIQHSAIQSSQCHEPKHITTSLVSDSGKVITPSSSVAGTSVLRLLTYADIAAGDTPDNRFTLADNTDATKKAVFEASGISTATTRTFTFPDASGTLVLTAATQTLTNKRIDPRVVALTDGANIAVNSDTTDIGTVTLAGNRTLDNPTGTPVNGQELMIRVRQDGTAGRTLAFGAAYRFPAATADVVTATANETSYLIFKFNSTDSTWDRVVVALDLRA